MNGYFQNKHIICIPFIESNLVLFSDVNNHSLQSGRKNQVTKQHFPRRY